MSKISVLLCLVLVCVYSSCRVNPGVDKNFVDKSQENPSPLVPELGLSFQPPATIPNVGQCSSESILSMVDVQSQLQTQSVSTQVSLSGPAVAYAYLDSSCTIPVVSGVTFPALTSSLPLYFKGNVSGSYDLNATSPGLFSGAGSVQIAAGVGSTLVITGQSNVGAGDCTSVMSVILQDIYGNNTTPSTNLNLNLSGNASATMYSDASCTTVLTSPKILTSSDRMNFYIKDLVRESLILSATATGVTGDTHGLIVTAGLPAKLVINVETPKKAGVCSIVGYVEVQDSLSNATNVLTDTNVVLSDSGLGKFYATSDCSGTPVTSITVTAGSNRSYMYYKNQKAETTTVTAHFAGLTDGTQSRLTQPENPEIINLHANLALAGSNPGTVGGSQSLALTAGDCAGPLKLAIQDKYFNLSPVSSNTTITLSQYFSSGDGSYYSNSSCTTAMTNSTFLTGESVKDIYYKGTRTDFTSSMATTTLPGALVAVNAISSTTVNPAPAHHLQLSGTSFLFSNECSPTFTIYIRDIYNNLVPQSSGLTVNIGSVLGSGSAFTSNSCSVGTMVSTGTLNIPALSSSVSFWLKDASTEIINQVVTTTGGILDGTNTLNVKSNFTNIETYAGWGVNWGNQIKQTQGTTLGSIYTGYTSQPVAASTTDTDPTRVRFYRPDGMVYSGGYLYYYDQQYCVINRINIATKQQEQFAGGYADCSLVNGSSGATTRLFNVNSQFTFDSTNSYLYFGDGACVRRMDLSSGETVTMAGQCLSAGYFDHSIGSTALFSTPSDIIDMGSYLLLTYNTRIRKINLSGSYEVSTVYTAAAGHSIKGLVYDGSQYLYYLDGYSVSRLDLVTPGNPVSVVAGAYNTSGLIDAVGSSARFGDKTALYFTAPLRMLFDAINNCLYVADIANSVIRKIDLAGGSYGTVTTLVGVSRTPGNVDGIGTSAKLGAPNAMTLDGLGNLYVYDGYTYMRWVNGAATSYTVRHGNVRNNYFMNNNNIRKIDLTTNTVSQFLGPTYEFKRAINTFPNGPKSTTPISTNGNGTDAALAYDGDYLYFYGNGTGGSLNMSTGDIIGSGTNQSVFGFRTGELIHNGYYYYFSGSVIMRGTVSSGVFSAAVANTAIAGNGTNSITDGMGTSTAAFNSIRGLIGIDKVNNFLYLWDTASPAGTLTLYLRKVDLATNVVTTLRSHVYNASANSLTWLIYHYRLNNGSGVRYDYTTNSQYILSNSGAPRIYKYNLSDGSFAIFAGSNYGILDGVGTAAYLFAPTEYFCIGAGYLWFQSYGSLRRIRLESGLVETLTSLSDPAVNQVSYIDGALSSEARLNYFFQPACEMTNQGLMITDGYSAIRRVY